MRHTFQRLALILFCIYLAVLPGSTIVVALDRVPGWGAWMGGALLLLQGAAALCWLVGRHGARGGLTALLVFLLAWAVEHAGVTSGVPFGRYHYTGALQPQLFGIVPLAIPCAWLMVATGAWQLATTGEPGSRRTGAPEHRSTGEQRTKNKEQRATSNGRWPTKNQEPEKRTTDNGQRTTDNGQGTICNLQSAIGRRWSVVVAATLVLLLDLQIETVATKINQYWIWLDDGPYYGVPTANFVAWWLVGLAMAVVVAMVLGRRGDEETRRQETGNRRQETGALISRLTSHVSRLTSHVSHRLPAYLYLLSTLMFAIINLAHGYTVAGLVGVFVLFVVFPRQRSISTRRRGDAERLSSEAKIT